MLDFIKKLIGLLTAEFATITNPGDYAGNLISYDDAITSGVFGQLINIDIGDRIFDNKVVFAPMYYLLNQFTKDQALTSVVRGYDRIVQKDILFTAAAFTSQATAGEALTLTLNATGTAYDKNNLIERQIIELDFTPGSGYTNEVYVYSKNNTDTTTISVKSTNPSLKIGTGSGEEVAANTLMNCLGTFFAQKTGSVEPISFFPTLIENVYQYFKTPYSLDEVAMKERLFVKGTLRDMQDTDAQQAHLNLIEKSFLFQGEAYRHDTHYSPTIDRTQVGKMRGLIYWLKNGGSDTAQGYETWSIDEFDDWQWKIFDPELGDVNGKRLLIANKATRKFFTDLKTAKQGVELAPNDTYGIPGITTIYTDSGQFDLFVHPKISARYNDPQKPFMMALTPTMITINPLIDTYLANGIQANDNTELKAEYRTAMTYKLHNAATPYHGILYPTV